ncbi:zinc-dependent alcohol dehydrogenase family protein [Acaryochloris sp. 'Moss Beach']|uniref:zinc-dependent alcohol dehydrogenase family protein n=1 Tax=Acaryochloris sp. 'Moss Beach' TaxID=2740837 RepID=UPI001F46FA48|nr:zinc-dependent alcohol dehydrogenase family protein [Acaryochloris sp. 'Moss Beach']UJB67711.1 zinc-dependent alcohol dehydrogenase family protein [Acaryochloris sp. 'Moss Beach']
MANMQAAVLTALGGPEGFEIQQIPKPVPKANQILVRVYATSINPVDYQTRRGDYQDYVQLPAVIGLDVSGVVEAVGETVTAFKPGDEVYYAPRIFEDAGSYAQYNVVDESLVAIKPKNLSHTEAACFPIAGGTAWESLFTRANLQVGESVLIHAGAGGVGSLAIQLAKAMGAYVFTTCSPRNHDLVKKLGADCVIDYATEDYVEVIQRETDNQGVDVVFDTIGGKTIQRSLDILRPFGRLVSIVDIETPQSLLAAWDRNLSVHFVFNPVNSAKLDALRQLIEREQLKPVIDSVMPWQQVSQAIQGLEQGGTTGKIVLDFADND